MRLQVPGRHNVLNALAATAVANYTGVSANDIRDSLAEFEGIKRRFERIGSWKGVTIIDDYAHHPAAKTSVIPTISASLKQPQNSSKSDDSRV